MNGIGGRTIAEAQERISHAEFLTWCAYRQKRGTLNLGIRIDHNAALQAMLYVNSKIVGVPKPPDPAGWKIFDFMPHVDEPPITLEQAMEAWK